MNPLAAAHAFGLALRARLEGSSCALPEPPEEFTGIGRLFGLTRFEVQVVSALFAAEIGAWGAHEVPPTVLATVLDEADWGALHAGAPLVHRRLVEVGEARGWRLADPVFAALSGRPVLDPALRARVVPVEPPAVLAPSQERAVEEARRRFAGGVLQIGGAGPHTRRSIAAAVARTLGLRLVRLPQASLPADSLARDELARVIERDVRLCGVQVLVELEEPAAARSFVERFTLRPGPWISADAPLSDVPGACVEAALPTPGEQLAHWEALLGSREAAARLAGQFDFELGAIVGVVEDAGGGDPWQACRRRARTGLDGLAQRLEARVAWDDLVVPPATESGLRQILAHVRRREMVMTQWGFGGRGARGAGLAALFHGPSGTGKTLAAEALASELELDLYRIDLSSVVSKYIGETEKHLRRLFDAAESGGAILLFDEADALFGKRSEVRDSHDRYANIEVGYLLQRVEAYRGLALLTTNLKDSLDHAFLRRLRFVLAFPAPDVALRAEIWSRALPPSAPRGVLDWDRLSRLDLSGAGIRNVCLQAAFLAADAGEPIGMPHLLRAARDEFARMGRTAPESLLRGAA